MLDDYDKLIVNFYFALTTLSTVGYGDFYAVSTIERLVSVVMQIAGVAFFSYIMDVFTNLVIQYNNKMGMVDRSPELNLWIVLLGLFRPV